MRLSDAISKIVGRVFTLVTGADRSNLYGLDHAILHIEVPPKGGMWMNMGYWKHTDKFTEACEALLDQILITANLISEDTAPTEKHGNLRSRPKGLKLVDVGIGCGDQTLHLMKRFSANPLPSAETGAAPDDHSGAHRYRLDSYVGITIAQSQADMVRQRLPASPSTSSASKNPDVRIFAADAADPSSWGPELTQAAFGAPDEDSRNAETWLLALDTLYHFYPSRKPLFGCAHADMQASFMAFDLMMSDSASWRDRLVLRVMCAWTGIPYSNFVTKDAYREMLVQAGYERDRIEMHDISEYVFPGIAKFLRDKDAALRRYGMTIGKFKGAAKVFSWWGTSGLLRGVVVVARRSSVA